MDRESGQYAIVASEKGGGNIEEVEPSKIHKFFFPPTTNIPPEILNQVAACFKVSE